jgi:Phage protein (N4 Gp49/phage Sf6 gene 66) family
VQKITPNNISDQVRHHVFFFDELLTIAVVTLMNGFKVVGYSACMNKSDYNRERGMTIAYEAALEKVFPLLAYQCKSTSVR